MAKKQRKSHGIRKAAKTAPQQGVYERLCRQEGFQRKELIGLGIVLLVAFAIRLTYFFINKNQNPLFFHPILDSLYHHDWATDILSGNFWGNEVYFRAPLYPYLLAFLYKVSGSSIGFAVFIQHMIGTATVFLTYVLAREYFRPAVALTAAAIAALYWPLIYFEGDLLIVTLIVALDTLLLWLVAAGLRRKDTKLVIAAGAIMGVSAIARPSILIFLLAMPWIVHFAKHGALVRNYIVGKDFVPIASQGGVNFYIGNNAQSNGSQALVPGARGDLYGTHQGAIELAEQDVGHKLKPSQVSNYYMRKGMDFIVYSPGAALSLTMQKFYFFWGGVERSNNKYIQFFWKQFGLGAIPLIGFWFVGPLGLCGGVLLWRRRRDLALLYLFVLTYMIGVVVFFVNARFRLPIVPALIVLAAYAAVHLFVTARSKAASTVGVLALVVAFAAIVNYDFLQFRGVRSFDESVSYYELGNAYLKMDRKLGALDAFEKAHRIQQQYPTQGYLQIAGTVDFQIGSIYRERGRASRAIEAFARIQPSDPAWLTSQYALAELYLQQGQPQKTAATLTAIDRAKPNDVYALVGLARVYKQMGDEGASRSYIERLRAAYPDDPRVQAEIQALESAP
jgi:4-amino-4-deoxy-L-arabinose transferase-like glycosyltransferase